MRSALAFISTLISLGAFYASASTVNADPLLEELVARNSSLTKITGEVEEKLRGIVQAQRQAETLRLRIEADFNDARATLKSIGSVNDGLGPLLLEHRKSLPDIRQLADREKIRDRQIAEIGVRRMVHREEAQRLSEMEQALQSMELKLAADSTPEDKAQLRELMIERQPLLTTVLEGDRRYLTQLQLLNGIEEELVAIVGDYDDFLKQHLWWIRATERIHFKDLLALPNQLVQLSAQTLESTILSTYLHRLVYSPLMWFSAIIAVFLQWRRRAIQLAIQNTAEHIGHVMRDQFGQTARALLLTFLAASSIPLILVTAGWVLPEASFGRNRLDQINVSLLATAALLFALNFFRWVCTPKGLAEAHFRWPTATVTRVRSNLDRLTWIFVFSALVISLSYLHKPGDWGGIVARLGFLVFQITLGLFLYRLLCTNGGVLSSQLQQHKTTLLARFYPALCWFAVLLPPWLAFEALAGYVHSAMALSIMYLNTLGLFATLALCYAIASRWLLVVHRRLAYDAAVERRRSIVAAREAKSSGDGSDDSTELELDEPIVNLTELSEDTRSVVTIATSAIGLVGLFVIWSPWFPALRVFDSINLWQLDVTVDGETQQLRTTAADIGIALIYLFGTFILVRRLPSLLQILLLQRSSLSESDRYTIGKHFTYTLIASGVLLALNAIGASWSQLQWLVAAMGVGIGFGLQEIVANFISGLIILFERPVRIGDVVTVGDTSGIVTKIRIRATTIRDWDRKELLVPNKDLITGRVLNWSLSDEMTRIVITVGVAYGTDVNKAMTLMSEAAEEHGHALNDPAPVLSFESFGDNALNLTMRVYVNAINHRIKTTTDLRCAINRKFNETGITIAYPQRDVHFDTREPLHVRLEKVD